jgi:semaphorin 6
LIPFSRDCVGLQDPYCAWDREIRKCVLYDSSRDAGNARFVQSILTGHSDVCGPPRGNWKKKQQRNLDLSGGGVNPGSSSALPVATDDEANSAVAEAPEQGRTSITIGGAPDEADIQTSYSTPSALYTMETLAVTVTGTGVGALLLGFLLGYLLGRKAMGCGKDLVGDASRGDGACVNAEYEFLEQRPLPSTHGFV